MDDKTYRETLERIGKHDAAMLVKWWLPPAHNHSKGVAAHAYPDLFTGHGLNAAGRAFAIEHIRRAVQAEDEKAGAAQISPPWSCRDCRKANSSDCQECMFCGRWRADVEEEPSARPAQNCPTKRIKVAGCTVSAEIVPSPIEATVCHTLKILQPISGQDKRRQIRAAAEAREPERRAIYKQQSEAQPKPAPIHTRPPTPGAVDITKSMRPAPAANRQPRRPSRLAEAAGLRGRP